MPSYGAVFQEMCVMGAADKAMVGSTVETSNITFWRFVHLKHTAFALEPVEFGEAGGSARFGAQNVKYTFARQGDLVWHTYAKIELPGIVALSAAPDGSNTVATGDDAVYWTNAIGQYLLQQVKLAVGGTVIDTLYDTYLFMWEELSAKPGKRLGEMIGKFDTVALRQATSKRSRVLYVPLPFYFTDNTGLALPLVSLQFHQVQLEINFAQRTKCYVLPAAASAYVVYVRPDGETGRDSAIATATSLELLADSNLACSIEACYAYLDHDERAKFAHGSFEQIITEVQQGGAQATSNVASPVEETAATKVDIRLQFNHVVQEYIFAVRQTTKEDANLHFDFGGWLDDDADTGSGLVLDPIIDVQVLFNNSQRVQTRPGSFFRLVQPYQHHTSIPREFVYCWSYAIDPEDAQPTGGANHSRIDNVNLRLNLDTRIFDTDSTAEVIVYARNKNLLRYKHGLLAKKFG